MGALIKFELRKLLHSKTLYVCLAICCAMLIINAAMTKALSDMMKEAMEQMGQKYIEQAGGLTLMKSTYSMNTAIIEGVVVTILVCEDFVGDIIKNVYSKGYSRAQVYFSKLLSSLIAFFAIFLIGMLVNFLTGLALYQQVGYLGKNGVISIFGIIFIALAYFVFYYAIAIMFKKIAPCILLSILGPSVISILLALLDMAFKEHDYSISDYWISGIMTNLSATDVETSTIIASFVVPVVVIALFGLLSFFINNKKDAK